MKNLTVLIFFISISINAQSKIKIPNDYKLTKIPAENTPEYFKLNYSIDNSIELKEGRIKVFPTPKNTDSQLKYKDGILIGSNHGEWGGKLVFKSDGKEIKIKDGNIISLFELKGKVYFLEGLAHLSENYGEIYEIQYLQEKFKFIKVLELPDEPQVFQILTDKIYMATFQNFIIISNWKIETKIKGFWDSLYPNSLIIENKNHVFMGIRGGIVEITIDNKNLKLYTKTN